MGVVASAKPLILTRFPAQQRIANRDQEMLAIDLDDVAQVRVPHDVRSVTSITYICTPFYSIAPHLDSLSEARCSSRSSPTPSGI